MRYFIYVLLLCRDMKLTKEKYFGLGRVPIGIGAVLKGWNIPEKDFRNPDTLPVIDFRAMTEACPHDCPHCFTDKQKKTLTLEEITGVIDELADMKTVAIDYLGEGEPTIDKDFFPIIDHTAYSGIQPIIFTDAATKMRDRSFVKRVNDLRATVVPKCDSLFNPEYQNWVLRDRTGKYFDQRKEALDLLIEEGFNEVRSDGATRLGLDMVLSKENISEVEKTLRFARENNIWVVFTLPLPIGRSGRDDFDYSRLPTKEEMNKAREIVKKVDQEYGFDHKIYSNFATSPCVEFMCIYGDGRVSPCVGNDYVIGNVREDSIKTLVDRIYRKYPCHDPTTFDGNCLYRKI